MVYYSTDMRVLLGILSGQVPEGVPSPLPLKPLAPGKLQALENVLHVLQNKCKLLVRQKRLAGCDIEDFYLTLVSQQKGLIAGTWEPPVPQGLYTALATHADTCNRRALLPEGVIYLTHIRPCTNVRLVSEVPHHTHGFVVMGTFHCTLIFSYEGMTCQ